MATPAPSGHQWRTGARATGSLTDHLRMVTESAANAAVENYTSDDEGELLWAAVSAGLAVEAAMKFSIAKTNPVLLADARGGHSSAVHLARHLTAAFPPLTLKTITGMNAYAIFRSLHDERKSVVNGKECEQVFAVRNAAVHMGMVDASEVRIAVNYMVVAVQKVMQAEHDNTYNLWSETNIELVDALLDERSTQAMRVTAEKKAAAARRLQALINGWQGTQREEVLRYIEMNYTGNLDGVEHVAHDCPVCGRLGVLLRHVTSSSLDFTGASYPDSEPSGERYAYPAEFACFVCGLVLDEDELYVEPGFDDVIEAEIEPSDEFEQALDDWRYEERAEQRREALREEWRRDFES